MRRDVLVVAGSENTLLSVKKQLEEYLGDGGSVRVGGLALDSGLSRSIEEEVAALSGDGMAEDAIVLVTSAVLRTDLIAGGFLGAGTPVIVAERTIDPEQLDRVVALSPGTRVLFVNDEQSTARECVAALCSLGIDGPEYLPWWPGCPMPGAEFRIAITPGESFLVPPGPVEIIDLGPRVLDFATLAELLGRLGLLESGAGRFSLRYLKKIVNVARSLAQSVAMERRLNEHLKGVLESLDSGILVYDDGGKVSVCTDSLVALISLQSRKPVGARLSSVIRNQALLDFLEGGRGDQSGMFRLADRDVAVRRFDSEEGRVAIFQAGSDDSDAAHMSLVNRRRGHVAKYVMEDIVGDSQAIQRARRIAGRLASTDLSILINGESGTGKELFASAIHAASGRRSGPFLAVDLGALSDDLIESELFGYEEGAFTGALKGGKPGLFELADGGTIFLDEIGNVSAKVQNRLLRVLQEKEVLRVGGSMIRSIDVRVIAATNEDLLLRARRGLFREDLYFRLKSGILRIPPLRERMADIPLLLDLFLRAEGEPGAAVEPALLHAFADYGWPGNVRELRNLIAYMLAVREGDSIALCDLPDEGFFEGLARPDGSCLDGEPAGTGPAGAPGAEPRICDLPSPVVITKTEAYLLAEIAALELAGLSAGREELSRRAIEAGRDLSPAMVRRRLEAMETRGLVELMRGRCGTKLTERGKLELANSAITNE